MVLLSDFGIKGGICETADVITTKEGVDIEYIDKSKGEDKIEGMKKTAKLLVDIYISHINGNEQSGITLNILLDNYPKYRDIFSSNYVQDILKSMERINTPDVEKKIVVDKQRGMIYSRRE